MECRHCQSEVTNVFLDLQNCPLSNAMLTKEQLNKQEIYYPLKIYVCNKCRLVSVNTITDPQKIFNENYTYFSSYSESWLEHSRSYVKMISSKFNLGKQSQIIEVASNDGYLLQFFKDDGFNVLGIDPAANVAKAAQDKGIETLVDFFSTDFVAKELLSKGILGDLIICNNVFAHVPDINDFAKGLKMALKPEGIITLEFPHLLKLIDNNEFDTIYHEHYSYLSFYTANIIFQSQGLEIFDVDELSTHGGSLRLYIKHRENKRYRISEKVSNLAEKEINLGIDKDEFYNNFSIKVLKTKLAFLEFLVNTNREGKKIVAYAAAAKGNTFLNYCGIKGDDLIKFVADASPVKQGKYLPGSHIPVYSPDEIKSFKPDYIIILAWNLKKEILNELDYVRSWGCKFVLFLPSFTFI